MNRGRRRPLRRSFGNSTSTRLRLLQWAPMSPELVEFLEYHRQLLAWVDGGRPDRPTRPWGWLPERPARPQSMEMSEYVQRMREWADGLRPTRPTRPPQS